MFLALVEKGVPSDSSIVNVLREVKNLLDDFVDMVPDELTSELPPLRDIQHAIDLVLGFHLPKFQHYMMNDSCAVRYAGINKIYKPKPPTAVA